MQHADILYIFKISGCGPVKQTELSINGLQPALCKQFFRAVFLLFKKTNKKKPDTHRETLLITATQLPATTALQRKLGWRPQPLPGLAFPGCPTVLPSEKFPSFFF